MGKYVLSSSPRLVANARRLRREMTKAEKLLWSRLRRNQLGTHFRKQVPFRYYVLDFASVTARLVVEVDGDSHYTKEGIKKDRERDAFLRERGFRVLRFSNYEVVRHTDAVVNQIAEAVRESGGGVRP